MEQRRRRRTTLAAASAARRASTSPATNTRISARRRCRKGVDLAGLKIVIDCANGAAYKVGPRILADLGAEVDSDRLLAERPQHQRRLRFHRAGSSAAHRARRARQCRRRARRRRRSAGDGGSLRPHPRRRPAALHHRPMPARREGTLQGPGRGHRDDATSGLEAGAAPRGRGVQARAGGRSLRARPAPRARAACWVARPRATSSCSTRPLPATGW